MKIQGNDLSYLKSEKLQEASKQDKKTKSGATAVAAQPSIDTADEYIPSQPQPVQASTYGKSAGSRSVTPDTATIQSLKESSEQSFNKLRELVRQLLERQGLTFVELKDFKGEVKIDDQTRAEAAAAVADGGPLSAESVSDNIVAFAQAISGGDKSKLETLRTAIDKGFAEASKVLGGSLPEISQRTHDLINQKLDAWANE